MASLLLLLLPAMAIAQIEIEVSGKFNGERDNNMGVYISGSQSDVISDEERTTFGLDDGSLKDAVRAYFGGRPTDAYLRSPTPWGDLYQSYGWQQVVRTLVPKNARILKITSEPQMVLQQIFENNSSRPATFNVAISQSVDNTVSSTWSRGGALTVGNEIKYGLDIEVLNIGGTTSLSYTSSWGENASKTQKVTVGASSAMDLLLQPGQSVLAELQATRGSIKVEVEYEASLSGHTAVNYNKTYKGHHFWSLDVQGVMAAGNLKNKMASKEVIDISFYSNARVVVHDRNNNNKMMEVAF